MYCDLDIDVNQYQGTTRQRFIAILTSLSPAEQAKVLCGVVERFPPNDRPGSTRTPALGDDLLGIARRLDAASPIDQRQPKPATPPALSTREAVEAFKTGLLAYATGGAFDASEHRVLRQQLLSDALLRARLPDFVSTCADPRQFWAFIKSQSPTYDGRRRFIREALKPVEAYLDGTSDGLSVRSSEQPPSGRPAAINTVGVEPTRRKLGVFLCHASGDKEAVRELYRRLLADGFDPWLDEEKLLPGQDWEREIYHAVHDCDVVVVCLSSNSITKTGYVQKELRIALDFADHQPEGLIFVIPAKLEQCVVPDRLLKWQWVNLHEPFGYTRLVQALGTRASTLSAPDDKS